MTREMLVEVVFVAPQAQSILEIRLPAAATVADAIEASGLQAQFPDYPIRELPTGIWGRLVSPEQELQAGDRVEIYRELEIDPMEARRVRALAPVPDPSEPH